MNWTIWRIITAGLDCKLNFSTSSSTNEILIEFWTGASVSRFNYFIHFFSISIYIFFLYLFFLSSDDNNKDSSYPPPFSPRSPIVVLTSNVPPPIYISTSQAHTTLCWVLRWEIPRTHHYQVVLWDIDSRYIPSPLSITFYFSYLLTYLYLNLLIEKFVLTRMKRVLPNAVLK